MFSNDLNVRLWNCYISITKGTIQWYHLAFEYFYHMFLVIHAYQNRVPRVDFVCVWWSFKPCETITKGTISRFKNNFIDN